MISKLHVIFIFILLYGCNKSNNTEQNSEIKKSLTSSAKPVYSVIHEGVRELKQPKSMDCWATALTMLYSWKYGDNNISIRNVLKLYGNSYVKLFDDNSGIGAKDETELYKKAGLELIVGSNPTIKYWYEILKRHGPLSITVDAKPPTGTIHALVLSGIIGNDNPDETYFTYIDPANGQKFVRTYSEFIKLYEGAVNWPLQIIYWPAQ